MASDWYDEMERAEQEYDAREYELAQEYSRGYEDGKIVASEETIQKIISTISKELKQLSTTTSEYVCDDGYIIRTDTGYVLEWFTDYCKHKGWVIDNE